MVLGSQRGKNKLKKVIWLFTGKMQGCLETHKVYIFTMMNVQGNSAFCECRGAAQAQDYNAYQV